MKNEITYRKGKVITPDEQYVNPIPFYYYKTLTELLEDYYNGDIEDKVIINVILELEESYKSPVASDGIHIILKSIKITIEEIEE